MTMGMWMVHGVQTVWQERMEQKDRMVLVGLMTAREEVGMLRDPLMGVAPWLQVKVQVKLQTKKVTSQGRKLAQRPHAVQPQRRQ